MRGYLSGSTEEESQASRHRGGKRERMAGKEEESNQVRDPQKLIETFQENGLTQPNVRNEVQITN